MKELKGNESTVNRQGQSSENWDNSHSENYDNSHSVNRGNSHSVNRDNSHSVNWHNSYSVNWDNSHSVNRDNSHSVNWHNSYSVNWDNSHSVNRGNSHSENWDNSHSENWDNSHSENWDNSHSVNRDNSKTTAFQCSVVHVKSTQVEVEAYDNATVYCHVEPKKLTVHGDNVTVIKPEQIKSPSFDDWIERGYVVADGFHHKLVGQKGMGQTTIYTVEDFASKKQSYVARIGDKFAHGETSSEAINDLRYKIADRDTSDFEDWILETQASVEEMIETYRTITGACFEGTKMFCENKELKDKYTVQEVIDLTSDAYGNNEFREFFNN